MGWEVDHSRLLGSEALRKFFGEGKVVPIGEKRKHTHFYSKEE